MNLKLAGNDGGLTRVSSIPSLLALECMDLRFLRVGGIAVRASVSCFMGCFLSVAGFDSHLSGSFL